MKKILMSWGLTVLLVAAGAVSTQAKIEWELDRDIRLDAKPIDTAVADDGTTIYILTKKALKIYGLQDGRMIDTIPLDKKYTAVSIAPRGNKILLANASDKSISVIQISRSLELPVGTSPVIGPEEAPVTLVAFIDFQCPYCSRVFPAIEKLLKKYPNELNVVIKHFPLRSHKFASQAAVAALAADRQGKYLELIAVMFKNFRSLNEENLKKYAEELGLDPEKLEQDRKDSAYDKQIKDDRLLARRIGVRGVPSLYINGRPVKNRSAQGMSVMVDEELKKE